MRRHTRDKAKAITNARKDGRKVIWLDDKGFWHAATNRFNTPLWALEAYDVEDENATPSPPS